jgi:hypothetical protein
MHGLAPYFLGGLTAAALMNWFATIPGVDPDAGVSTARAETVLLTIPERSHKGDRLASRTLVRRKAVIAAIEVGGVHHTVVVYRDRDGRVLFKSDPLTDMTVVAKDVVLPQVTIHDNQNTNVAPVTIPDSASKPAPLAAGCDSAVSPLAAPLLARLPSRCIAAIDGPIDRAAL